MRQSFSESFSEMQAFLEQDIKYKEEDHLIMSFGASLT